MWGLGSSLPRGRNRKMERVGIMSLKRFLQILLDQHIERELPKVREEIMDHSLMGPPTND